MEEKKESEVFSLLHDGIGGTAVLGWQGTEFDKYSVSVQNVFVSHMMASVESVLLG